MRLGDYIVLLSMLLNVSAACLYLYQGHYVQTFYWLAVAQLNLSLIWMK